MSYAAYGYGIGSSTVGSPATYGLGINFLIPIVAASIAFDVDLDKTVSEQLDANTTISFNLDTFYNVLNQLDANPDIIFNIELLEETVKQILTDKDISFDTILNMDIIGFISEFNLRPLNVHLIREEVRFLDIFWELRKYLTKEESRICSIKEEIRVKPIEEEIRVCSIQEEIRVYTADGGGSKVSPAIDPTEFNNGFDEGFD